jgi:branched-subunit amino acid aminotransferase/4-amino-4-deoxychorismate lyase
VSPALRRLCWADGELLPLEIPVVRADDSAFCEGRGCYTSVLIRGGRPRFAARHARRLVHGAAELGLGPLEAAAVLRALAELAKAAFDDGDGIVRLEASRDGDGRLHLIGVPREAGPACSEWSAVLAPFLHAGPGPRAGVKVTSRLRLALAAETARAAGVDEALLLDASGWLVEGSRSSIVVVSKRGEARTPPLARGAVAGVARGVVLERVPGLAEGDVSRSELAACAEIIAVNAVRGALPITRLEGRPVGDGKPGPWTRRLAAALEAD